jgi:hypothetical protein
VEQCTETGIDVKKKPLHSNYWHKHRQRPPPCFSLLPAVDSWGS